MGRALLALKELEGESLISRDAQNSPKLQANAIGTHVQAYDAAGQALADIYIGKAGPDLVSTAVRREGEPAVYYPLVWGGEVGIISPVTCRFCSLCNRLRLTPDGFLKPCLGANIEVNIKEKLRNGADDQTLKELFVKAIMLKPEEGQYIGEQNPDVRPMVCVGG